MLADPLPVSANLDGIELDDWSQILDSRAGPFGADITATNSRFRTDPGEDATFMDAGLTDLFSHLFILAPAVGRLPLLSYVDFVIT